MRLDLGLLQMEFDGRPDGFRPEGYESLLEYHQDQLDKYIEQHGNDEGFYLDPEDCSAMRNEALPVLLPLFESFHLKEYRAVARDTDRIYVSFLSSKNMLPKKMTVLRWNNIVLM